jgi:hypothetical protein
VLNAVVVVAGTTALSLPRPRLAGGGVEPLCYNSTVQLLALGHTQRGRAWPRRWAGRWPDEVRRAKSACWQGFQGDSPPVSEDSSVPSPVVCRVLHANLQPCCAEAR